MDSMSSASDSDSKQSFSVSRSSSMANLPGGNSSLVLNEDLEPQRPSPNSKNSRKRFKQNDSLIDAQSEEESSIESEDDEVSGKRLVTISDDGSAKWLMVPKSSHKKPPRKKSSIMQYQLDNFCLMERKWDPLVLSSYELNNRKLLIASIKRKLRNNLI